MTDPINVAKLTDAEKALLHAAATIGVIYEQLAAVEDAGGCTSISGVAAANAFLKSLRKNAARVEKLVLQPAREAIGKMPS